MGLKNYQNGPKMVPKWYQDHSEAYVMWVIFGAPAVWKDRAASVHLARAMKACWQKKPAGIVPRGQSRTRSHIHQKSSGKNLKLFKDNTSPENIMEPEKAL